MKREESNIVKIKDEVNDYYADNSLYHIVSWGADLSFRELITMYKSKELVKPELQRRYVWDKSEASRFIDSLLSGLPVPSIFLAKVENEQKLIIDGYQRIMTVYDFVERGVFSGDDSIFKLSRTDKINEKWRGKTFQQLDTAEQRRITSTTIHAIIFEQKFPKDVSKKYDTSLYQVFERINTSGRTLLPQEIRNCVYHGNLNRCLLDLNNNTKWRFLYGINVPDSRMRDLEFILRFFSLSSKDFNKIKIGQISLKKYLNEFMGDENNNSEARIDKLKEDFGKTIDFIENSLGRNAFNNLSTKDPNKFVERFHPTIFDAISVATLYALNKNPNLKELKLKEKQKKLLQDVEFKKHISRRTTNVVNIRGRIALALKHLYNMVYA